MSVDSALDRFDSLDTRFAAMAEKVENIDLVLDPKNPESLLVAENDLIRIIEEMEHLQKIGVKDTLFTN